MATTQVTHPHPTRDEEQAVEATHAHPTCTQCGENPGDYVALNDFRSMMKLVRLQTTIPISVMISMGTLLVCGLVIHPGMRQINELYPTLLTPNGTMLAVYWSIYYAFQIGFCLLLLLARSTQTKDLFINGVGLRYAVSHWCITGWAVCWTLRMFRTSEVFAVVNLLITISIIISLLSHPASFMHPLNSIFVNGSVALLFAMLFELTVLHNGFVAVKWVVKDEHMVNTWTWPAVGLLAFTNSITLFWEIGTHNYMLAIASEYILFTLLFASVRMHPSIPDSALPKPAPLLVTTIIFLCLHPMALIGGNVYNLHNSRRQGQIRLPEDDEEASEREREIEAEVEERLRARDGNSRSATPNKPARPAGGNLAQ